MRVLSEFSGGITCVQVLDGSGVGSGRNLSGQWSPHDVLGIGSRCANSLWRVGRSKLFHFSEKARIGAGQT